MEYIAFVDIQEYLKYNSEVKRLILWMLDYPGSIPDKANLEQTFLNLFWSVCPG